MPVTTYISHPPKGHPEHSERVAELWEEFQSVTGNDYFVRERAVKTRRWFREDIVEYEYDLLFQVHSIEFQIMQCVETEEELLAYMYGAINGAMNSHNA